MVDAREMGSERASTLQRTIVATLRELNWPNLPSDRAISDDPTTVERCLDDAETYLCELKESQIRTGLHRLGQRPAPASEQELLIAMARAPQRGCLGLTQAMARHLELRLIHGPRRTENAWTITISCDWGSWVVAMPAGSEMAPPGLRPRPFI